MRYRIAADARPQFQMLVLATIASIALWLVPYASILTYPFRLFVTFIHEGGHALAAVVTLNRVASLSVSPDSSGLTMTTGGPLSNLLISSAGYLGTMAFGVLLLVLIRKSVKSKLILFGSGVLILMMTAVFGFFLPVFNLTGLWGIPFTVVAGLIIGAGLVALGLFASPRVAQFFACFLAVQCVLNALFDLKNVFLVSSPFTSERVLNDAGNMATATGVPAIFWSLLWIGLAVFLLTVGLRIYATAKHNRPLQADLPFDAPSDI